MIKEFSKQDIFSYQIHINLIKKLIQELKFKFSKLMKRPTNEKKKGLNTTQSYLPTLSDSSLTIGKCRSRSFYNIQDYLPEKESPQMLPTFRQNPQSLQTSAIYVVKTEIDEQSNQSKEMKNQDYIDKIEELSKECLQMNSLYKKEKQQRKEISEKYERLINQFEKEKQNQQNAKQIEEENNRLKRIIRELEDQMERRNKKEKQFREEVQENQARREKKQKVRLSNIRMYYQKYDVKVEPKQKHFYSIEVQTVPDRRGYRMKTEEFQTNPTDTETVVNYTRSNRKLSQHVKANTYYQVGGEKISPFEPILSTSRSKNPSAKTNQMASTGYKPKKPSLLLANESTKQNDLKKINERIQGKVEKRCKIKQEEVQVYPIDKHEVNAVVQSILRWN